MQVTGPDSYTHTLELHTDGAYHITNAQISTFYTVEGSG